MKKSILIVMISCLVVIACIVFIRSIFPQKYKVEIDTYSSMYDLPKSFVASVINIESGYRESAVSNAGAKGVMQLLPSTALDCADRIGLEITEDQLFDAETNIMLGCFYLRYLLDLFDGNWINTLSAYNWGYGNVRDWIRIGNADDSGTIIDIPVEETERYIKKFKVSLFVYEKIYKY